jgi:DNA-binding FadR family transcriptional regulator
LNESGYASADLEENTMTGSDRHPGGPQLSAAKVRVPKTAELVAARLRAQIVRGELNDGDSLPPETELIDRFGISRPTLREAFRVLESEALISVRRGARGGARVHAPTLDVAARNAGLVLQHRGTTMADLYVARTIVEPPCAAMLARGRSAADLQLLWQNVEQAEAAIEEPDRFIRLHTEFHGLIVDLAGNQTLALVNGLVRNLIDLANWTRVERDPGGSTPRAVHRGARAHRRLVEHIEAREAEAAETLWRTHLVEAGEFLSEHPGPQTVLELLA